MKYGCSFIIFLISSASFAMKKDTEQKSAWTQKYHNTSQMQFQFAQSQLPQMNLQEDENLLDVGCGTGRTTHLFAQHLPKGSIIGIDSSEDMITFAQEQYGSEKNIDFQVVDASRLEYDNKFDRVISFFCLQWLKEKQEGINGIAHALKKGGRSHIFLPVTSKDYDMGLNCILEILAKHSEWKSYCTVPSNEKAETWVERAQKSGLTVVSHDIIPKLSTYASKKEWNEYCSNLGITTLPDEEKQQFITEVNDLLYGRYGLEDDEPYLRTTNILSLELVK